MYKYNKVLLTYHSFKFQILQIYNYKITMLHIELKFTYKVKKIRFYFNFKKVSF